MSLSPGGGASRPEGGAAYIDWLRDETVTGLRGAAGDAEALREVVLFYLRCAYQAGLDGDTVCDVFADLPTSVLSRAHLSEADQSAVMDAFEALDPIVTAQHRRK
jgi:hypothetical protein